jgi:hypothetical protein
VTLGGVLVLYVLALLGKLLKRFGIDPLWLRQFQIGKSTLY